MRSLGETVQGAKVPGAGRRARAKIMSMSAPERPDEMTVTELKERIDSGDPPVVIDVREPREYQICRIPGSKLIPLGELPSRLNELDPEGEIVLHCRSGSRSANATAFLRARGFSRARNLKGGVLAWIDQVDPSQPKY
jgi:rhodanese-related sulfurtransferase